MAKRTDGKSNQRRPSDKGAGSKTNIGPVEHPEANAELLVWKRVKGKGLFELYRQKSGNHFVRRLHENRVKTWPLRSEKAEAIFANANSRRTNQLKNVLLRNGYVSVIDGKTYDTRLDQVLFVGVGDETEAAAIYRTRDGEVYVHVVEPRKDILFTIEKADFQKMRDMAEFWFNRNPSFLWFTDIIEFDGPLTC